MLSPMLEMPSSHARNLKSFGPNRRYEEGKASYFEVLDAQLQLYPKQNDLAQTELNCRVVLVQLYLPLGGGWDLTDPQWASDRYVVQSMRASTAFP
jgi:hypothetical protein